MNNVSLSLFQKILLSTDGTVTDLLALYTGEVIRVTKLEQSIRTEVAPTTLACDAPVRLLSRKILLHGADKNYLYADSLFVFDRFTPSIQHALLETDRPIGLLWKEEKLETYREVIAHGVEPGESLAKHFALPPTELFVSRTYLIHHANKPLGAITEKWPLQYFNSDSSVY